MAYAGKIRSQSSGIGRAYNNLCIYMSNFVINIVADLKDNFNPYIQYFIIPSGLGWRINNKPNFVLIVGQVYKHGPINNRLGLQVQPKILNH